MTSAAQKQVVEKALALPKKARERLLKKLIESLDAPEEKLSKKEWSRLWKNELNMRIEESETGKDPGVPLEVIWEDLQTLNKKK
jgi:putative addiction module component (TIGR02574 family)